MRPIVVASTAANGLLAAGRVRMTSSAFSMPTRRGTM